MSAAKARHEFYQTPDELVVSVFIKNLSDDQVKVDLKPTGVNIDLPEGQQFNLEPLSNTIVPEKSSYRVSSVKIELKLAKEQPGLSWVSLEKQESQQQQQQPLNKMASSDSSSSAAAASIKASYPSSSKKKTDWNAIERQVSKEEEDGNDDDGANKVFQKLYANATDDQKRAMMKSYTESNGTSLSTNWDEVKTKKVETLPPDGMVAKKWDA